ncbi:MAG: CoA transferase [Oscillospiraceae bacterium]|nr:CoA transferase [Oscillospiraceae bacterium]
MRKPLEGVRVLDLTQAYSGPFCTMNLADLGAEVIKIERPGVGDQTRTWGPFKNDYSAYYAYVNRNKKGITLDLGSPEGKELFKKLLKNADVVCENYKVGTMEKLGFSYETMKEINPGIIYASISGFGLQGRMAKRPCYDIIAQGMSGMMSVTGFPDAPPVKIGPSIGDNYSGAYLCIGILASLYKRQLTGEGARIDVAMVDTLFSVMENFVVKYTVAGENPTRAGNIDPGIAPFDSFRARDAEFVMGCGTDRMFEHLCQAMGREDLLEDPRFSTNDLRCINYLPDLKAEIEKWSTTKTVAELEPILVDAGIPFGPIQDIPTVAESELIRERNMLWDVDQPGMDAQIRIPGCPIKIHGQPDAPQKASPTLGEDNEAVYGSLLGLSKAEIDELRKNGTI